MDLQVCRRVKVSPEELSQLFVSLLDRYSAVEVRYITLLRLLYDSLLSRLPERVRGPLLRVLALLGLNRLLLFYEVCVEKWDVNLSA